MLKPTTQAPEELWPVIWKLSTGEEWPPQTGDYVDSFFRYADREMLLPLLMMADGLPEPIAAGKLRFRPLLALHRRRYELVRAALPEFTRIAGAEAFLFYKGFDFCHRLYARPELRPMSDIDVLVPRSAFDTVLARFAREGIAQKRGAHGASFSPDHHEASVMLGEVHFEIHRSFSQPVRARFDYEGLWNRREKFAVDDVEGLRLSEPDALLCQAYELAKDEFSSPLIRYVDLFLLLRGQPDALSICVERARAWRIERALFGALFLTERLFPSARHPLLSRGMNELLTARQRAFLADHILPDPALEHSNHGSGRLLQVQRKFMLIDNLWQRLALAGYAAHQEVKGSLYEWRARRAGAKIPPRWRRRRKTTSR
jgi:hypothetical protein